MPGLVRALVSPLEDSRPSLSCSLGVPLSEEQAKYSSQVHRVHFPMVASVREALETEALRAKVEQVLTYNEIDWSPLITPQHPLRNATDRKVRMFLNSLAAVHQRPLLERLRVVVGSEEDSYVVYAWKRDTCQVIRVLPSGENSLDVYCTLMNSRTLETNQEVLLDCMGHFFLTLHLTLRGSWRVFIYLDPLLFPAPIRKVFWQRILEARAIRHLDLGQCSTTTPDDAPCCLALSSEELLTLAAVVTRLNVVEFVSTSHS